MAEYAQRDDRQSDISEKLDSPRRKPISRQERNSRSSDGTVCTPYPSLFGYDFGAFYSSKLEVQDAFFHEA